MSLDQLAAVVLGNAIAQVGAMTAHTAARTFAKATKALRDAPALGI